MLLWGNQRLSQECPFVALGAQMLPWMPQCSLSTFQHPPGYPDAAPSVQMSPQDTQVSLKVPRCCPDVAPVCPAVTPGCPAVPPRGWKHRCSPGTGESHLLLLSCSSWSSQPSQAWDGLPVPLYTLDFWEKPAVTHPFLPHPPSVAAVGNGNQ